MLAAATAAGTVVGWSRTLPGICGAAGVVFGLSAIVHATWRWLPAYAVAALVAGVFGLLADRRIP